MSRQAYREYVRVLDVDAFEAEIGFEPTRQATNKHGEAEDVGHCPDPWHLHKNGDRTGKFAINRDKRVYNCFVCGGGSLLDLAMAVRGIDEQDAVEWLSDFARPGEETKEQFLSEIEELLAEHEATKPIMPFYNQHVLEKWTANLAHIEEWLADRGISDDVAVQAELGYQADATRKAPQSAPAGARDTYSGPAVYFPHFWGERLVGWQQRWLDPDRPRWLPKYTNTSGFPRAETIYGYDRIYLDVREIIVVESVPTALMLWSFGHPAVATFGGAVTDEQMRLLRRCQQGIVLAPDNDVSGRKWTGYTGEEQDLRRRGKRIDRVIMADYLARYVPVRVMEAVGEYDSGNDLGDLLDEGPRFAREAVRVLLADAGSY